MFIGIYKDGVYLSINVDTQYTLSIGVHATRKVIMDMLMGCKYSVHDILGILCDYLDEGRSEDTLREFRELQEHRKISSRVADHLVEYIRSENLQDKPDGIYESYI